MKKLLDSVAFQSKASESTSCGDTRDIKYAVQGGQHNKPCLHLVISSTLKDGSSNDMILDISREDMVEILNDIVDEWPEIVDLHKAPVKRWVEVLPVFS